MGESIQVWDDQKKTHKLKSSMKLSH